MSGLAVETIPAMLRSSCAAFGSNELIVLDGTRRTYAEIDRRSALLARALLAAGIGKGSRVGLLLGNGPDWIEAWFAAMRIGAVVVPLSTFYKPAELRKTARHADLQFVFFQAGLAGRDYAELLEASFPGLAEQKPPLALPDAPFLKGLLCFQAIDRPWAADVDAARSGAIWPLVSEEVLGAAEAEVDPEDWAFVIYTSGSTAAPKGVIHSHRNVVRKATDTNMAYRFASGDRCYHSGPWFWVGGLVSCLLPAVVSGATIVCTEVFDAGRVLGLIETERLTNVDGWPHQMEAIVKHPSFERTDRSSLGPNCFATSILPAGREPRPIWSCRGLGMTETLGMYAFHDLEDPVPEHLDSEGRIRPGFEIRLIDELGAEVPDGEIGEYTVRGGTTAVGLYKQPRSRSFDADGWFHTGDLGFRHGDYLWFRSRQGDMIKTAGANVAPPEVEIALFALPEIREAYVAGLPDPIRGQVVAAAVVPHPGAAVSEEGVREALRSTLSTFKIPAHVFVVGSDAIPRSANDKFKRVALAELMQQWLRERELAAGGR